MPTHIWVRWRGWPGFGKLLTSWALRIQRSTNRQVYYNFVIALMTLCLRNWINRWLRSLGNGWAKALPNLSQKSASASPPGRTHWNSWQDSDFSQFSEGRRWCNLLSWAAVAAPDFRKANPSLPISGGETISHLGEKVRSRRRSKLVINQLRCAGCIWWVINYWLIRERRFKYACLSKVNMLQKRTRAA